MQSLWKWANGKRRMKYPSDLRWRDYRWMWLFQVARVPVVLVFVVPILVGEGLVHVCRFASGQLGRVYYFCYYRDLSPRKARREAHDDH